VAGQIFRMSGDNVIALTLDVAAVEIEIDDALGKQAALRPGNVIIGADTAGVGGICART
jgi:hypothetical protein